MLGKLIKHEFIATWKYLLFINAVALVSGLLAAAVGYNASAYFDKLPEALQILLILGLVGYVFILFSATLLTTVCNVVRYYKSLYTTEGYLTFTLPATTTEILSAKMLVAIIWQVVTCICVLLSVMMLIGSFILYGVHSGTVNLATMLREFHDEFLATFGIIDALTTSFYIIKIIMQLILNLMIFFFAITLGQLWQQHKIIGSIIAYFCIRFIYGIFSFFMNLFSGSLSILFSSMADPGRYFSHTTNVALIISIVVSVAMYIGCIVITDKKLNLD